MTVSDSSQPTTIFVLSQKKMANFYCSDDASVSYIDQETHEVGLEQLRVGDGCLLFDQLIM